MSTESSAGKWLLGCALVGVLLVLLCGGGLFMIGWLGYRTASQVAQTAAAGLEDQMRQMQFAAGWTAPAAGSGADVLFPAEVNAWQLAAHDEESAIVELGLARDGRHARYESGVSAVDVYAYEVPPGEQSQVFHDAAAAIENVGYSSRSQAHVDDGASHRMTFSFSPPETYGRMWWSQGWLFVFKTSESTVNLDAFLEQYLTTIGGTAAPDPQMPPSGEPAPLETKVAPPAGPSPESPPMPQAAPESPDPPAPGNPEEAGSGSPPQ